MLDDLRINAYTPCNIAVVRKVITSDKISSTDKNVYLRENRNQIYEMLELQISPQDFSDMMQMRPLIKYRPVKNSFTKKGDRILLSKSLNISLGDIDKYVEDTVHEIREMKSSGKYSPDEISKVKSYVYRHGKKEHVAAFLNYELEQSKNLERTLTKTLEFGNGGLADYYVRPIHRLTDKTFLELYKIIDNNLLNARSNGILNDEKENELAKYALTRLYEIQEAQRIFKRKKN